MEIDLIEEQSSSQFKQQQLDKLRQEIRSELEAYINNSRTYYSTHAEIPEVHITKQSPQYFKSSSAQKQQSSIHNNTNTNKQLLISSNQKVNQSNTQAQYNNAQQNVIQPQFHSPQQKIYNSNYALSPQAFNSDFKKYESKQIDNKYLTGNQQIPNCSNSNQQPMSKLVLSNLRSRGNSPDKHKLGKCKKKVQYLQEENSENKKQFEKKFESEVAKISNKMFNEKKFLEEGLQRAEQKLKEYSKQELKVMEVQEKAKTLQREKKEVEQQKKQFKELKEENMELGLKVQEQDRVIQMLQKQVKELEKTNKTGGKNNVSEAKLTKKNNELINQITNLQLENKLAKESNAELQNNVSKIKKKNKKLKEAKEDLKAELEMAKKTNILYSSKYGNESKSVSVQYEKAKS